MRNAFVYVIGWVKLDTWYAGSRYRKGCDPKDLWTIYYTSSKHVKEFVRVNGKPDVIKIMKVFGDDPLAARLHEQRLLKKFKVLNTNRWLNKAIGGHHAGRRGPHTDSTKQKIADAHRGKRRGPASAERIAKQKATYKKNYEANYEERFKKKSEAQKGKTKTAEHIAKISKTLTGQKLSASTKAKISIASKNMNHEAREKQAEKMRGRKWYTNGEVCVRELSCPEGFRPGRLKWSNHFK